MVKNTTNVFSAAVIVAALGYFVDVYDILLFSIVRTASLQDLGLQGDAVTNSGLFLLNMQMAGMLIGGILWGVFGDKKGRLRVLFGSILLYSIANLANAFVQDVPMYAVCRFFAGLGLAGELGAGITLVAESLSKEQRGLGTTLVATVGVSGAIAAALVGDLMPWRHAYIIAGVMGLLLLLMRASVRESFIFKKASTDVKIKRGQFQKLFTDRDRFKRYFACILIGVPVWYVVGVIVTLSPEIAKAFGITEPVKVAYAVLSYSITITIGDLFSGLLSQLYKTRKKILIVFLVCLGAVMTAFFIMPHTKAADYYGFCALMGFFIGTWVVLLTTSSEMFGTNLRATVTSTVPNLVRGSTILLTTAVTQMKFMGYLTAVEIVGFAVMVLALLAAFTIPETFHNDLDFNEKV